MRTLSALLKDDSGQFAVIAALVGVPLVVAAGLAIETSQKTAYQKHVKSALDTAALAAVIPANMNDAERVAFAKYLFTENYIAPEGSTLELEVEATRSLVEMKAEASLPTYLGAIAGYEAFDITEESAAALTQRDVICLFALDPLGERSIEFTDSARFNAPACTVQSNSSHAQALYSDTLNIPKAQSFCSVGGSYGEYYPRIKNNCTPVKDPYKNLEIPAAANHCDSSRQVVIEGSNDTGAGGAFLESELLSNADGESLIPDFATLSPGIYCRGLEITGANVKLEPGVYHVWGNLKFSQYAGVVGEGVTFILKGERNRLIINEGAEVILRAPSAGLTKGLVFWQKYLKFRPYLNGIVPDSPDEVIATSEISSGAGVTIIGTAYLPDHELVISSQNAVATQAPATSFIARRIRFEGKSNVRLRVDHEEAGVPPILPRSDDSVRLVR